MLAREPMSRVDAAWLHMDRPENTADIVALFTFGEDVGRDAVEKLVSDRLLRHRRFRERIVERSFPTGPAWEPDPRFTLARHLSTRKLSVDDPDALSHLLSEVATEPLDRSRPPWRMVLASAGRGAALVTKLHHCVGDGFALVSLLFALSDEAAPERAPPRRAPSFQDLSLLRTPAALAAALRDPARLVDVARQGVAFARSLAKMALLPLSASPALARPLSGFRRTAWTRPLPLARIRETGAAAGATVNEVLLAALAGALRRVLAAAGERVDGMTLRAIVPVNMREERPDPAGGLGNRFGLEFVALPVGLASPAARLEAVRASVAEIRRSPDALVAYAVLGAFGFAPGPLERLGTDFFTRKASLVVTNVPGPARPLHMMGRRLDRVLFWVPHPAALGLGVSLISYAGEVSIGVRADASVLPEPAELARAVEAELGEPSASTGEGRDPTSRAS